MAEQIVMPQLGESVVEGTIAEWFVKPGQKVEEGAPMVEVETDKANAEVPVTTSGYVKAILVEEGETVDVGTPIIILVRTEAELGDAGDAGDAEASSEPTPPTAPSKNAPATPSPAKTNSAPGAGPRVNQQNSPWNQGGGVAAPASGHMVEGLAMAAPRGAAAKPQAAAAPAQGGVFGAPVGAKYFKAPPVSADPEDTVIKFTRRRGIIAEHMVYSKQTAPHVPCFAEVDMTKVVQLRKANKDAFKARGISLTVFSFVLKATTEALREFPGINAVMGDNQIIQKGRIHLGFAAETPAGLVVPVIKDADSLSVSGLAKSVVDLATRARDKKITMDDLSGGTFTVSNPGRKGNLFGAAVINQPQSGILRMGEIVRRPVVRNMGGEEVITIRSMMYLALTYDHRVIDGVLGNSFLHRVRELLEESSFQL